AGARRKRPDVGERAAIVFRERGRGLRLRERLAEVGRAQHLHPEEGIAARGVDRRLAARVDHRRVDRHARTRRPAQRELAPGLSRLRDEDALLGSDGENDALRHVQPPETAGRIVTTSPGTSAVSSPSRSRTWDVFTNRFTWRRTVPVSSQMLRYRDGWRRSSCTRASRTLGAESESSEAPSQQARSAAGTW